jgi:hypothetical protein
MFHVSSKNRQSIKANGLDWTLMGASRGIAGSSRPEQDGCFLSRSEGEADFFVRMNNTGGPVDVWAVDDVDEGDLVVSPENFCYVPFTVPSDRLTLIREDIPAEDRSSRRAGMPGGEPVQRSSGTNIRRRPGSELHGSNEGREE